jgi:hypothetical protein
MNLRLRQWPVRPDPQSGKAGEFLLPARLVDALTAARDWVWIIDDGREPLELDAGGDRTQLVGWHRQKTPVATERLWRAMRDHNGVQLTWGILRAYERGEVEPVLTIEGIDSTWYDIDGSDDVVSALASSFSWAEANDETSSRA